MLRACYVAQSVYSATSILKTSKQDETLQGYFSTIDTDGDRQKDN